MPAVVDAIDPVAKDERLAVSDQIDRGRPRYLGALQFGRGIGDPRGGGAAERRERGAQALRKRSIGHGKPHAWPGTAPPPFPCAREAACPPRGVPRRDLRRAAAIAHEPASTETRAC